MPVTSPRQAVSSRSAMAPRGGRAGLGASALIVLVGLAGLAGCAQTGPQASSAQPVLYPNEAFNRMGSQAAQAQVQACEGKASDAGLTPRIQDNPVGRGAAQGAAVGGTLGAVAGLFNGGIGRVAENAAKGAVAGGATGAVSGSFNNDKPNPIYRNFVTRCVQERGLEVIGWN